MVPPWMERVERLLGHLIHASAKLKATGKESSPFSYFRKRSGPTRDSFLFLLGMMNDESLSLS